MNDLLRDGASINSNGIITSLELLEQINMFREQETGRAELRHDTLRDIIKDEFSEEVLSQQILEKPISSNGGRPTMVYELTLSQAKQVLVRESKFVRKAVISYIDKLENCIKASLPRTFSEALQLAANQAKEIEEKNAILIEQAPKVDFFDAVADSKDAISIGDLSKILGIKGYGRNNLFEFLRNKKVLMENNTPMQRYQDMGLFRVIEQKFMKDNEPCINIKTLVYQKGVQYVRDLINKELKTK